MSAVNLTLEKAYALSVMALVTCGASRENAAATARALISAEADGQQSHGLTRIPSYCCQLRSGKVDGKSTPSLTNLSQAALGIDAHHGFAYPALELATRELVSLTKEMGVAMATIRRSHHFGQAGAHVERLAEEGFIGIVFGNSPKAIAYWGSSKPAMGTNPIAFAAPLQHGPPLVIDLAFSVAARGKIVAAEKVGKNIPLGWALDSAGLPTQDPKEALSGSMVALGGVKGAALALMVEVLAAALTGSAFGFEASSLFTADGEAPNLGQTLIALNPEKLSSGAYFDRMAILVNDIKQTEGARLPGIRRLEKRKESKLRGVHISQSLYQEIMGLANKDA